MESLDLMRSLSSEPSGTTADGEQGPVGSLVISANQAKSSSTSKSPSKIHTSQELEKNRAVMYSGFIFFVLLTSLKHANWLKWD